jgi:hypothetical protein
MRTNIQYVVTKESDDGTFLINDKIRLEENGDISSLNNCGWIDKEKVHLATKGMKYKINASYYKYKREKLSKKIEEISDLLVDIDQEYEI